MARYGWYGEDCDQAFARALRDLRKRRGMTLYDVAPQAGLSVSFLSDLELGRRGATSETIQKLEAVYGVRITITTTFVIEEATDG